MLITCPRPCAKCFACGALLHAFSNPTEQRLFILDWRKLSLSGLAKKTMWIGNWAKVQALAFSPALFQHFLRRIWVRMGIRWCLHFSRPEVPMYWLSFECPIAEMHKLPRSVKWTREERERERCFSLTLDYRVRIFGLGPWNEYFWRIPLVIQPDMGSYAPQPARDFTRQIVVSTKCFLKWYVLP